MLDKKGQLNHKYPFCANLYTSDAIINGVLANLDGTTIANQRG